MKNKINRYLFIIGLLPFIIVLIAGLYASVVGYSPIYISYLHHGWYAFMFYVNDWSINYWPSYIVGIILIFISIVRRGR